MSSHRTLFLSPAMYSNHIKSIFLPQNIPCFSPSKAPGGEGVGLIVCAALDCPSCTEGIRSRQSQPSTERQPPVKTAHFRVQ